VSWWIAKVASVPALIAAVARHLRAVRSLSFEIHKPCADARSVYERHAARGVGLSPERDTRNYATDVFFCRVSVSLARDLEQVLRRHRAREVFWHVKGFDAKRMLIYVHDADMGQGALLASDIGAGTVHAIASELGRSPVRVEAGVEWNRDYRLPAGGAR
jgi:hypothetical protein